MPRWLVLLCILSACASRPHVTAARDGCARGPVAVTGLAFETMARALVIAHEDGRIERWDPFTGAASTIVDQWDVRGEELLARLDR